MIIIDKITQLSDSASSVNFIHNVSSSDCVLVIFTTSNSTSVTSLTINGSPVTSYGSVSNAAIINGNVFYIPRPNVGNLNINVTFSGTSGVGVTAISLLGVNKKSNNPIFAKANGSATTALISISPSQANSFILDSITSNTSGSTITVGTREQTQVTNQIMSNNPQMAVSFKVSTSKAETVSWNFSASSSFAYLAIVLEPDSYFSIWNTSLRQRSIYDVAQTNSFNTKSFSGADIVSSIPHQSTFYKNSFLHTVGRLFIPPTVVTVTAIAETEQQTAQIIVDKVFQGQKSAVALSTVTLTMDVSIPSQNSVLIVTGGSVIATGAQWASITLNNTPLTKLVQTIVAGADAEIWFMSNPPVGTYPLTITSGTGGEIYANAMVVLGIDIKNPNIITSSIIDAASTSTITGTITPDAPNSLIIDTLATLNATTSPTSNSSQTQVFNATALVSNEYVISTYKLGSNGQQIMNYNLGAAVNASLVTAAFRPARALSMWSPGIGLREIDDTVTTAGLDAELNPAFGQYGYKPSTFYKNSFLHTIGRYSFAVSIKKFNSTLLLMGVG